MKHLNLKLEKLEQRIAPTGLVMLGDVDSGSYASPGGSVFSQVSAASLQSVPSESVPSTPSAGSESVPSTPSAGSESVASGASAS